MLLDHSYVSHSILHRGTPNLVRMEFQSIVRGNNLLDSFRQPLDNLSSKHPASACRQIPTHRKAAYQSVTEAAPRKRVFSQGKVCPGQNSAVRSGGGKGRRNEFNCFMTRHDYEISKNLLVLIKHPVTE